MMVDPYSFGVLQKEHHARLVADLNSYARDAGIQPQFICKALPETMTAAERQYLVSFRRNVADGVAGLVMSGANQEGTAEHRMFAMAGALVRNFIRARVMTLGTVIDLWTKQDMPEVTALLIPNFFHSSMESGTVAKWQVNTLYDYLIHRQASGLQTILYASDLNKMAEEYGVAFKRHLDVNYKHVKV